MEHFVTLFDKSYLPQGLALYRSMTRHFEDFTLWVIAMDDEVHRALLKLDLPSIRILRLSDFEDERLFKVRQERTLGEYCWTLTPLAPLFVFDVDKAVNRITYIDADIWFRKSPEPIFREFEQSKKSVLITDHAYAPEHDQSATSGQFCVQFMTFLRDRSEVVRKWWEERCIDWCFARAEDGKFGDQKYLDDWPWRFCDYVHVLAAKDFMQAPWNATRFPYSASIIWHFHGAKIVMKGRQLKGLWCGNYSMPKQTIDNVYKPYMKDLEAAISMISSCGEEVISQKRHYLIWSYIIFLRGIWWRIKRFQFGNFLKS